MPKEPDLPDPECEAGYTVPQLHEILGDRFEAFEHWMRGQTMAICEGRRFVHETRTYRECCGGQAHGVVVYPWDLKRFLEGKPIID
jgi:hypothetical protein